MFGKKNVKKVQKTNERDVRKVLGKDKLRRTFGFLCSPLLQAQLKKLAEALHVPLFATAEHALQLGTGQMTEANDDPEQREELQKHITSVHVGMRTIEKISAYDEEAAGILRTQRLRDFEVERATRQLVMKYARWGCPPEELDDLVLLGRCAKMALRAGWQPPPAPNGHAAHASQRASSR